MREGNYEFGDDSMQQQFLNLPKDVFIYLFSKLEVCSIIRCRSVCKHWLRLLSDPDFVKLHLNHSKTTTTKLLIESDFGLSYYIIESYDYSQCNNTPLFRPINFPVVGNVDLPLIVGESVSYCTKILGSCNGLLCLFMHNSLLVKKDDPRRLDYKRNKHKLLVWNPSTRDYKILPDPINHSYCDPFVLVGFGYDSSCQDYKLVQAYINRPPFQVEMYSLKTNLWKVIKIDSPYTRETYIYSTHEGIFVNGSFLYWLVMEKPDSGRGIVGYDLKKEKFKELQCLPVDINGPDRSYVKLLKVVGGEKLGLCFYYNNNLGLWMMNKEGDKEEWSKLSSISYGELGRQLSLEPMFHEPICDFENGNVLFYNIDIQRAIDECLVLSVVDAKLNKIVGRIPVSGITPCRVRVETYIETLLSPNAPLLA